MLTHERGDLRNKGNKDPLGRHYITYVLNIDRVIVRTYRIYVNCSINDIILIPYISVIRKAPNNLNKYKPVYPYEPSFEELSDICKGEWLPKEMSPTPGNLNASSWRNNNKLLKRGESNETLRALQPQSNNTNNRRSSSTNFRSPCGKKQAAISKYRPTLNTNRGSPPLSDSSSSNDENKGPGDQARQWHERHIQSANLIMVR